MKKRVNLKLRKERAVLSELLPYEVPLTFSNADFYHFLVENKIEYKNSKITWLNKDNKLNSLILLLIGEHNNKDSLEVMDDGRVGIEISAPSSACIPFTYTIKHKKDSLRRLSIAHPKNQIRSVEFYEKYKNIILYYGQKSEFSIRAPLSIAKRVYLSDNQDNILSNSIFSRENDISLKSYFVYKHSNIFQFFESKDYHECEKKYNNMGTLDISKFFDSIYTHSMAWAVFGKNTVKDVISDTIGGSLKDSFSDKFDKLLQKENYNETNGIIIGPEQSRIFAELILQAIDCKVLNSLNENNIIHRQDYEIYRYVDDYFVFFNDLDIYKKITKTIQLNLNEFKLNLNTEKEKIYHKPIITDLTIAKKEISSLIDNKLAYTSATHIDDGGTIEEKTKIHIKPDPLITQYKTIVKKCNVEYADVLNYTFSIIEPKCNKIIKVYKNKEKTPEDKKEITNAISSIVEFIFFIYSASPRVNTTIKLCRLLYIFTTFLKSKDVTKDQMDGIYKQIFENIFIILSKSEHDLYTQVETLYLLIIQAELGRDYRLEEKDLAKYFGAYLDPLDNKYKLKGELNNFSITVALFYMAEKVRYNKFKECIKKHIIKKLDKYKSSHHKDAEKTMLLLDITACPYVDRDTKVEILKLYGETDVDTQNYIIDYKGNWFTKWRDFSFAKALDSKKSLEVY